MGKEQRTAWVCDNPDCQTVEVPDEGAFPEGYVLQGVYTLPYGGGPVEELYACEADCLPLAVKAVVERRE